MTKEKFNKLREFNKLSKKNALSAHASEAAFFLFLSLIPGIFFLFTMISYTSITENNLTTFMINMIPDMFEQFFISIISEVYNQSIVMIILTATIAIWSSTKGILALMRAFNIIHGTKETRNFILVRLLAAVYAIILLGLLMISLVVMVSGNVLVDIVSEEIPQIGYILEFIMSVRFMFMWVILASGFMILYTFMPNRKVSFIRQFQGALFTSVLWSLLSWGFSVYVENFKILGEYGGLFSIVILMLWLYISMYLLFVGAMINENHSQTTKQNIIIILVLFTLMFIWGNSVLPGTISTKASNLCKELFGDIIRTLQPYKSELAIDITIRKMAHFIEFMLLGIVVTLSLFSKLKKYMLFILLGGFGIAFTDEYIQTFTDGRVFMVKDIGIDMLGYSVGIILIVLVRLCYIRIYKRDGIKKITKKNSYVTKDTTE